MQPKELLTAMCSLAVEALFNIGTFYFKQNFIVPLTSM